MGLFSFTSSLQPIEELYVGETKFIKEFIDVISAAREPYVGKGIKPIHGNKDFVKIGDMIAKEFGFKGVTFTVPFNSQLNAFCYPIVNQMDRSVYDMTPTFKKGKGIYYDRAIVGDTCTYIAVTSGVWFGKDFTDREVAAAILHEIGHSFTTQSEDMIDIMEIIRIVTAVQLIMNLIGSLSAPNPKLSNDIKNIIVDTSSGQDIINAASRELANNDAFRIFNSIREIKDWIVGIILGLFNELFSITNGYMHIVALPKIVINALILKICKPFTATKRSQEYLSDSFATMYGLGPEISSFLTKIEYSDSPTGAKTDKLLNSIPIIGATRQLLTIPALLIMNSVNVHPSTPARIKKVIRELEQELKNSDIDEKTKKEIRKDIKELEKVVDDMLNQQVEWGTSSSVKKKWLNFLMNKENLDDDLENYYTDLNSRNKYLKK